MNAAEVAAWRQETRSRLLAIRAALSPEEHRRSSESVRSAVAGYLEKSPARVNVRIVGAYLAFRGEIDLLPVLLPLLGNGVVLAFPVVLGADRPLEFRTWKPGEPLASSRIGVQEPLAGEVVHPDLLLIPMLGYDAARFRLGYGGGFYDRTLRAQVSRPVALGVGFSHGGMATIHPQPWDVPLDGVLTELGSHPISRTDAPAAAGAAGARR